MAPEPDDDLLARIRALAEHLDESSTVVDPAAAMAERPLAERARRLDPGPGAPGRRLALVAAILVVLIVGAALAVRLAAGSSDGVDVAQPPVSTTPATRPTDPTTAPPVSTTVAAPSSTTLAPAVRWTGTPWADLPATGLASIDGSGRLRLFDLAGKELGTAEGSGLDATELGNGGTTVTIGVGPGPTFAIEDADATEAPAGCDGASTGGRVRVALCPSGTSARIVRVSPTGEQSLIAAALPASQGIGHWASAAVSPDGRWILAQWSGECEVPSAWLIPVDGGSPRLVTGESGLGDRNPNSSAVGWTPDGRALVTIEGPEPACGSGQPAPGTYAVDPSTLERTLVIPAEGGTFAGLTWRRED